MIDGHGDDIFRYGDMVEVNFSTNIHQGVDHSNLMRHLGTCTRPLSNYPEPEPRSVEARLALNHNIDADNVIVTNGATESIYLIARKKAGSDSEIVVPTFREYQDACKMFGHNVSFITEQNFYSGKRPDCRDGIVWLCNPNNPTGKVFARDYLLDLIDSMPGKLFVIDQAYADYATAKVLSIADVTSRHNVIMLHSLTKQFAIPGLRIGYAIASATIVSGLKKLRMPWAVNSFAIEAAHYLLNHADEYRIDPTMLNNEARRIASALKRLGISSGPTDCNFILCRLPRPTSAHLKKWLVEQHGLLIRDASNFETLDDRYFRIAAQDAKSNDRLIKCIEKWISL